MSPRARSRRVPVWVWSALIAVGVTVLAMLLLLRPDILRVDAAAGVTAQPVGSEPASNPAAVPPSPSPAGSKESPSPSPTPSKAAPPPSPKPSAKPKWIIFDWRTDDREVKSKREVARKLEFAPLGFQKYAAAQVGTRDEYGCRQTMIVDAMHSAGFVFGSLGGVGDGCGGGSASLWTSAGGSWREAYTTQDMWPCETLKAAGVPKGSGQECYLDNWDTKQW